MNILFVQSIACTAYSFFGLDLLFQGAGKSLSFFLDFLCLGLAVVLGVRDVLCVFGGLFTRGLRLGLDLDVVLGLLVVVFG